MKKHHRDRASYLSKAAALLFALVFSSGSPAMEPREIAERFDYVLRKSHKTVVSKFSLSTCQFQVSQKAMSCVSKPRVSILENVVKFYGDDIRSAAIILEPARDRGIGTLNYEYYDPGKDNSTWIYLSALGKIKRIIASQDSGDSGSFFGSEFLIEDMDYRKLDQYQYSVLGNENLKVLEASGYADRPTWILEWTPSPDRLRKSQYRKIVTWIDQERFILLKEHYYNHDGKLFKQRTVRNVEQINSHWMPRQVTMTNLAEKRVTLLDRKSISFDWSVPDAFLSKRTLTDRAFRERYLSQFRQAWM